MIWEDDAWAAAQPIYHSRLARLGGTLMVGTYLFLALTVAGSAWLIRKLWHLDAGGRRHQDAKDAGGHDEHP